MTLTSENFFQYALSNYNNPSALTPDELDEDIRRFTYVKRLLPKRLDKGETCDKMIINHMLTLKNVFGVEPATRMLLYKCDQPTHKPIILAFLVYMNFIPMTVDADVDVLQSLRSLQN